MNATQHAQLISQFDEAAEAAGEAHRQRAELRAAAERNTLLAQQHRADLDTIRQLQQRIVDQAAKTDKARTELSNLRTALTEAQQENEILRGELQTARNSQPAIDWLGREM